MPATAQAPGLVNLVKLMRNFAVSSCLILLLSGLAPVAADEHDPVANAVANAEAAAAAALAAAEALVAHIVATCQAVSCHPVDILGPLEAALAALEDSLGQAVAEIQALVLALLNEASEAAQEVIAFIVALITTCLGLECGPLGPVYTLIDTVVPQIIAAANQLAAAIVDLVNDLLNHIDGIVDAIVAAVAAFVADLEAAIVALLAAVAELVNTVVIETMETVIRLLETCQGTDCGPMGILQALINEVVNTLQVLVNVLVATVNDAMAQVLAEIVRQVEALLAFVDDTCTLLVGNVCP